MIWVFWIGAAVVTGLAAQARGRSFFGWLMLGFLFSVFALIAVLVMAPVGAGGRDAGGSLSPDRIRREPVRKPAAPSQAVADNYRGYEIVTRSGRVTCRGVAFVSAEAARAWVDAQLGGHC